MNMVNKNTVDDCAVATSDNTINNLLSDINGKLHVYYSNLLNLDNICDSLNGKHYYDITSMDGNDTINEFLNKKNIVEKLEYIKNVLSYNNSALDSIIGTIHDSI